MVRQRRRALLPIFGGDRAVVVQSSPTLNGNEDRASQFARLLRHRYGLLCALMGAGASYFWPGWGCVRTCSVGEALFGRAAKVSAPTFLAMVGTILGLCYGCLGIAAGEYFVDEVRRRSIAERVFLNPGWSIGLGDEYTDEGRRLCRKGNLILVAGILCWFGWGVLR